MSELYMRIAELCEKTGISIAEMCRRTGVGQQNITELKKGRQNGLSASNLNKIANYFGVSASYLLGEKFEGDFRMEDFIIVRKRRDYSQNTTNPKISTDAATYRRLADVASESGLTISEIAKQAIIYALDRLKYADE